MQPESQRERASSDVGERPFAQTQTCDGCRAEMPAEMRFCRLCGYRLGEGVAEYAETMRFADAFNAPTFKAQVPTNESMARSAPQTSTLGDANATAQISAPTSSPRAARMCGTKRTNWVVWIVLFFVIFAPTSGAFLNFSGLNWSNLFGGRGGASRSAATSDIGVRELSDAGNDGGAVIDVVTAPGVPLDRAGLVGGDAITMFDGQTIHNEDDLRRVLAATPIGKTVEVVFIRDGESRRTTLTTVSEDERERLEDEYEDRPEGHGRLGISDYDRVPVPGTNIYGVRIRVSDNLPAYLAGLRTGDIIIEFGGVPIRTSRELVARIERAVPLSDVIVVVMRDGQRLEILVRMGRD